MKKFLLPLLIFFLALLFNAWITSAGRWPDPDSFYHTRMAMLMAHQPVVRDFPWLTQTVFADAFVDHHWLYHLLLVPFVALGGPVPGMRLAALLFASLLPVALFLLIASWGSRRIGLAAAMIMILNNPFGFRANLAKAPAVSDLIVLAGIGALGTGRWRWAAVVAALFVWTYNGWPMLLVVAGTLTAASLLESFLAGCAARTPLWPFRSWSTWRAALAPLAAVLAGIIFALIVNPYFPQNIFFSWLHIVQIGIIGFREQIGVGGEWYGIAPLTIVAESAVAVGFFAAGAAGVVIAAGASGGNVLSAPNHRQDRQRAIWMVILAIGFFILTAHARRHIEYFIPFLLLAAAALLHLAVQATDPNEWRRLWQIIARSSLLLRAPLAAFLLLLLIFISFRDIRSLKHDYDVGISPATYAGLAAWFDQHAPEGSVVWHSDWDDFPYFFLHTTRVRFILGLDPAFMYVRTPSLYWEWVRETKGESDRHIGRELRRDFGADYAFVDRAHTAVWKQFAADPEMHELYRDAEGAIYSVPQ